MFDENTTEVTKQNSHLKPNKQKDFKSPIGTTEVANRLIPRGENETPA